MPTGVYERKPRPKKSRPECIAPGCEKSSRTVAGGLCPMHQSRWDRGGKLEKRHVRPERYISKRGYIVLHEPAHPLAMKDGTLYEHRKVFHEKYGDGPYQCHVCAEILTLTDVVVDHYDEDKSNNDPKNLLPACSVCNIQRARSRRDESFRERHAVLITWNGRTLPVSVWARELGLSGSTFSARLRNWSLEKAFTEPHGLTGPKRGKS